MKKRAAPGEAQKWLEALLSSEGQDACVFWPFGRFKDGCGALQVGADKVRVPRYICARKFGAAAGLGKDAAHSCGNGHLGCVNPNHLRWDTRKGNLSDKIHHGTHNRGAKNPQSKLSEREARQILSLRETGRLQKEVAAEFGVSRELVGRIWRRQIWEWL